MKTLPDQQTGSEKGLYKINIQKLKFIIMHPIFSGITGLIVNGC